LYKGSEYEFVYAIKIVKVYRNKLAYPISFFMRNFIKRKCAIFTFALRKNDYIF